MGLRKKALKEIAALQKLKNSAQPYYNTAHEPLAGKIRTF